MNTEPRALSSATGVSADDKVAVAMAHELRTPLTTIRSVTEILQDNPDLPPAERAEFLVMLAAATDRLQRTVDGMLRASTTGSDRWCVETADLLRPLTPA
jgi:signal transduction histidine kinase